MSNTDPGRERERLEFEDDEARAARLGNLFSSISAPPAGTDAPALPLPPSRPFAMPESDALARARAFLPLLAASNADLLARAEADPDSVVIENPTAQSDVVAMDVGLGVFDVNGQASAGMGPVVERDAEVWERANVGSDDDEDEEMGGEDESSDSSTESESSSDDESGSGDDENDKMDDKTTDKDNTKGETKPKVVEL